MEEIIQLIQSNVHSAPWIMFGLLLLAGFNIPVSEDLMLFLAGWLAAKHPEYLYQLFLGVYAGAYISDLICYWLGRKLGPKLWQINFFKNMVSHDKVDKISSFYKQYGMLTLIFGRFIPFGVRNALFLTAGLGRMNFAKFAFSDWIACTISNVTFFAIYYKFGETAVDYVKAGNKIFFAVVVVALAIFFIVKRQRKKIQNASTQE